MNGMSVTQIKELRKEKTKRVKDFSFNLSEYVLEV